MKITFVHRLLAVVLASQPVFWMSDVAFAQTLDRSFAQPAEGNTVPTAWPPMPAQAAEASASSASPFFTLPATRDTVDRADRRGPTAPPIDEPIDADKYICGPGDVFELNFWGLQSFKLLVKADLEGRAFVDRVGFFELKGKTLSAARRMLRDAVARYYPKLNFEVTLSEPRTFLVQVVHAVPSPASYPARAIDRVSSVIARAGGFAPGASKRRIEIQRRGGETIPADLLLYTLTGDVKHNPYVLDGDIVRVPFEDLAVSITGAVNRSGRYELVGTRDLAELLAVAGGLSPAVTRQLPTTVVRRTGNDEQQNLLPVAFGPDGGLPPTVLQHEDAVRIPSFDELQESVRVIGAVTGGKPEDEASTTRRMQYVHGDTVRTLIERIGGVGPLADLGGAYILRNGRPLPVDLEALLVRRDLEADRPVELGDSVVVPFKRRTILVEGAVFTPGQYPYNPTFGIEEYLALAGGPNRFARSLSNVRVITPAGETKVYSHDLKIEPGSSLVMPERNFSRSEIVQIVLSAAGIILSGVAVVTATR
jgi:polysaccharide biosynthesis/export protein